MAVINPLDIPEIIIRVGKSIPLWVNLRSEKYVFHPRDLLSCCLVSRSWRQIMLPILWYTYDETTRRNYSGIPTRILLQYAPLFKIIRTVHPDCSQVTHVDMSKAKVCQLILASDRFAYSFNLNNPFIRLLDLQAETNTEVDHIPTDAVPLISLFPTLLHLRLRRYEFRGEDIERILFGKRNLETLEFYHTSIHGPIQLSLQHSTLTRLHLQYCHIEEDSLLGLLRAMPGLQSFAWLLSKANILGFNNARIRDVLERFCPKLQHVHLGMHCKSQTTYHLLNLLPHGQNVSLQYISLDLNTITPEVLGIVDDRGSSLVHVSVNLARKLDKFIEMGVSISKIRRLRRFCLTCKLDHVEFRTFLQESINNSAPDVAWISTTFKDQLKRNPDLQTHPLQGRWLFHSARRDFEQEAPLFDLWILNNIVPSSRIQEMIINGESYITEH